MIEAKKDTARATEAAKAIFDGRSPKDDWSTILVTTEHAVASVLLALFPDPSFAAKMLNEGLVQGIENRLALYASKAPS
jgi:hypothetical protein